MSSKIRDLDDVAAEIQDGQSVASTGVIGWLTPDAVLASIGRRFDTSGGPRDLTFYFTVGTGDAIGIPGMDRVAKPGLMRRIISGSYINPRHPVTGERPRLMDLIQNDVIEAYSWPIGATMHWLREVARRSPGYLTEIGIGTYADPRNGGGKFTSSARDDLIELVTLKGREYLFYPSWPLDVGIIRASSSDEDGNLSFESHPLVSSAIGIALAVKASGGKVIAQVDRLVPRRSRPMHDVRIPASLVDYVVVVPGELKGSGVADAEAYLSPEVGDLSALPRIPASPDKVVARRVAKEARAGEVAIFGFGAPSDAVLTMVEDGTVNSDNIDDYHFTTEHGPFGGVVMSDWQFSANYSPVALLDGLYQFDFIGGGGAPFAALAFAQIDGAGRVNVTRFGNANPGAGGFIDIAHNARRLVFAGTLTTGGLRADSTEGQLTLHSEGRVSKFVESVDHITYDAGAGVRERGQETLVITERAVFSLSGDGFVLIEAAPGVDVRKDILQLAGFPIQVSPSLKTMDADLFRP